MSVAVMIKTAAVDHLEDSPILNVMPGSTIVAASKASSLLYLQRILITY